MWFKAPATFIVRADDASLLPVHSPFFSSISGFSSAFLCGNLSNVLLFALCHSPPGRAQHQDTAQGGKELELFACIPALEKEVDVGREVAQLWGLSLLYSASVVGKDLVSKIAMWWNPQSTS